MAGTDDALWTALMSLGLAGLWLGVGVQGLTRRAGARLPVGPRPTHAAGRPGPWRLALAAWGVVGGSSAIGVLWHGAAGSAGAALAALRQAAAAGAAAGWAASSPAGSGLLGWGGLRLLGVAAVLAWGARAHVVRTRDAAGR